MAGCSSITGAVTKSCSNNVGGIVKLYIANAADVSVITDTTSDGDIDIITMASGKKFYEFQFRKDLLQFQADEFIQTVVVVHVEESSSDKIVAKVLCFFRGEHHVAVACHVDVRVGEQVAAAHVYSILFQGQVHR